PSGISTMVVHDNRIVARGNFTSVSGIPAAGIAQYDGGGAAGWTPMSAGWPATLATVSSHGSVASFGGSLYATGLKDAALEHADAAGMIWNGQSWSAWPATGVYPGTSVATRVAFAAGETLIVEGRFHFADPDPNLLRDRRVAAWDGGRWIELGQSYGINLDVNGLYSTVTCAARYNGRVYIGGGFASLARGNSFNQNTVIASGICMWDGSELQPLPNGGLNGAVTAMAVYQDELYVVGNFTATKDGQVPLNRIASFDGAWHAVGGGTSQYASRLVVADDGTGEKLHIINTHGTQSTAFNTTPPVPDSFNYLGVMRWNGLRFEPYGPGITAGAAGTGLSSAVVFDSGAGPAIHFGGQFSGGGGPTRGYGRWGPGTVALPDADLDGIPDSWEQGPIDANCDGVVDLNLAAMGADWRHKDVFVEVDSMSGRAPTQATIDRVIAAFAAAPANLVNNPDGLPGIKLHVILDPAHQSIPLQNFPDDFVQFHQLKSDYFGTAAELASPNRRAILDAKKRYFRYCIFGNRYGTTTSSGLAETPGDDFMVTLGGFRTPGGTADQQASTFMHEMGHTLGLHHGGNEPTNFKPNYHSVMNYSWQINSHVPGWTLDYSRRLLAPLDETNLDELLGIGGAANTMVMVGPLPARLEPELGPIDWSRDGAPLQSERVADINHVDGDFPASPGEVLTGHEDWSQLQYNFRNSVNYPGGDSPQTSEAFCRLTSELAERLVVASGGNPAGCLADMGSVGGVPGADGQLNNNDFVVFVDYFFVGDPRADVGVTGGVPGADGSFNNNDFVVYVDAFFAGC
ncbi:MAG TPA: GC-type dockerin domain-anchored protein, partial [Phycisphaerales bacterium]|nr:GC-type dockerin domain-anchored protein [Phycisphaerales bacterium]